MVRNHLTEEHYSRLEAGENLDDLNLDETYWITAEDSTRIDSIYDARFFNSLPELIKAADIPFDIIGYLELYTPGTPITETHVLPVAAGDDPLVSLRDASLYRTTYLIFEWDGEMTEIMDDSDPFAHAVPGEHGGH